MSDEHLILQAILSSVVIVYAGSLYFPRCLLPALFIAVGADVKSFPIIQTLRTNQGQIRHCFETGPLTEPVWKTQSYR